MGTKLSLRGVEDCKENATLVEGKEVITPDGLAVDWVHQLLFWTDTGLDQVIVNFFFFGKYASSHFVNRQAEIKNGATSVLCFWFALLGNHI